MEKILQLMKIAASADKTSPVAYSYGEEKFSFDQVNAALRASLADLAGDYSKFRENKNTVFALIEQTIDDVLPKKVLDMYGQFAEVRTVAQGDKPIFTQRITPASRTRAKQFITRVGLAGVYEVFKLDGRTYTVETNAMGGAAQIGLEEFLDGRIDFADVLDIILEGLDEAVYREVAAVLAASVSQLPAANKVTSAGFDKASMDRLVQIADAYGQAAIYCTYEFAATMVPAEGWISDAIRDTIWNVGYLANYQGHKVIILPQSFEDATNATKVIDPSHAYVIPAGADKPVKIVFEGQTITDEYVNKDRSREVQVYKKVGVGAVMTNNICVFTNTDLDKTWTETPVEETPTTPES